MFEFNLSDKLYCIWYRAIGLAEFLYPCFEPDNSDEFLLKHLKDIPVERLV